MRMAIPHGSLTGDTVDMAMDAKHCISEGIQSTLSQSRTSGLGSFRKIKKANTPPMGTSPPAPRVNRNVSTNLNLKRRSPDRSGLLGLYARQNQTIMNREALIEERMPVWSALSELFLDTELQPHDIERISNQLAESTYTTERIEEILRFEVTPPLKWNRMVVAGEWAFFDEDFLRERISPRIDRKPLLRFPVIGFIQQDWRKIQARIKEIRNENRA